MAEELKAEAAKDAAAHILDLIMDECRYWHGRDEARRGNFATLYAEAKEIVDKNTRTQLPSQGGEAVAQVFTTWHPDSRSYEEQIVSHDTKGSRKALGAMNAKLRAKVGRLERELATVKKSLTVEPVAYAAFAENGNIRMWCRSAIGMCELFDAHGNKAVPLYTRPADQVAEPDAELVACLKFARTTMAVVADNANLRGVEYRSLIAEIKRIDAKLASLKGVEE